MRGFESHRRHLFFVFYYVKTSLSVLWLFCVHIEPPPKPSYYFSLQAVLVTSGDEERHPSRCTERLNTHTRAGSAGRDAIASTSRQRVAPLPVHQPVALGNAVRAVYAHLWQRLSHMKHIVGVRDLLARIRGMFGYRHHLALVLGILRAVVARGCVPASMGETPHRDRRAGTQLIGAQ